MRNSVEITSVSASGKRLRSRNRTTGIMRNASTPEMVSGTRNGLASETPQTDALSSAIVKRVHGTGCGVGVSGAGIGEAGESGLLLGDRADPRRRVMGGMGM